MTKVKLESNEIDPDKILKSNRKRLTKKVKKACRTRWLSMNNSSQSVNDDYVAIMQTLRVLNDDPTALGLLKKNGLH